MGIAVSFYSCLAVEKSALQGEWEQDLEASSLVPSCPSHDPSIFPTLETVESQLATKSPLSSSAS